MIDDKVLTNEQKGRLKCMYDFLQYLNKYSGNYILKGGTALMFHYGLPRFSEDIDLDSNDAYSIRAIMDKFCKQNGYTYTIKKDTDFTLRFMVKFAPEYNPLKVEISFRCSDIPSSAYVIDKNVKVYNIDALATLKIGAYGQRDKIRDLFDCSFIVNHYYDKLSFNTINSYISTFQHKGLGQLDYLVETQADPLIDTDNLVESFLSANDKLGLLKPKANPLTSQRNQNETNTLVSVNATNGIETPHKDSSKVVKKKTLSKVR